MPTEPNFTRGYNQGSDAVFFGATIEQRIKKLEADLVAIKVMLDVHLGAEIPE